MDNVELLQAVSELVTIASHGIAEAIQALPDEADDEATEAALHACTGHIDMIVMAAEMAELPDLHQHCLDINASLQALQSTAGHSLKVHGQHLLAWSHAILAYVENPDATLPEGLPLMAEAPDAGPQAPETDTTTSPREWADTLDLAGAEVMDEGPMRHSAETLCLEMADEAFPDEPVAEPVTLCATAVADAAAHLSIVPAVAEAAETDVATTVPTLAAEIPCAANAPGAVSMAPLEGEPETAPDCAEAWESVECGNGYEATETAETTTSPACSDSGFLVDDYEATEAPESTVCSPAALAAAGEPEDASCLAPPSPETAPSTALDNTVEPLAADPEPMPALAMTTPANDPDDGQDLDLDADRAVTMAEADGDHDAVAAEDFFAGFQQLIDAFAELEPWRDILTAAETTDEDAVAAAHLYKSLVEQIQTTSESLGLDGFSAVCEHVSHNVEVLATQAPAVRVAAQQVLEQWATLALSYLHDPSNDTQGFAIVTQLQQETWPVPLNSAQAEALYSALSPDATEDLTVAARPTIAQPEDVELAMGDDVNPRLLEVFLRESPANAADFSACITRIGHGEDVFVNLRAAQRLAHNMKGSANLVGVKGVANLTHHVEDILEYLSENQVEPSLPLVQTLQEAADCVEAMFEALQGIAAPPPEAQRVLQHIFAWANLMDAGQFDRAEAPQALAPAESLEPAASLVPAVALVPETPAIAPVALAPAAARADTPESHQATSAPGKVVRIPVTTVDRLYRMVGEMSIALDQLQGRFTALQRHSNELRLQNRQIQQRRFEMESFVDVRHVSRTQQRLRRIGGGREVFDPLELNEYDELYSASRSFIEAVMDSAQIQQQLRSELSSAERMLGQMQRMKRDLETVVRGTRMEEVSTISARLQRSVRQACRTTGKQAELAIEGAEVLLDSEMLDKLADPLMHILRNAVDHGIEASEQRLQRGKAPVGTIRLRFFQEGNTVVVQCSDDGQGLDYPRIQETAITKGLLSRGDAVNPQALARLTLTPGFSTRATATQLSGRGVGLDVVYTAIKELKGVMEIGDAPSGGCKIVLRLPLTLLTSHCLVVSVAGQLYAIPTSAVARALPPRTGQFSAMGTETAFEIGQEIYPARSLAQQLHLATGDTAAFRPEHGVLLVYSDAGVVALTVEQVIDSYHLVVKSLGPYIKAVRGVVGLATLADGGLLPVLDVAELLRAANRAVALPEQQRATLAAVAPRAVARVLIVDDSLSVRQSLAELLEDAGYQPLLARDGVEAVEVLRTQAPDLVLTDIEMPRMNGLELVSYIRSTHSEALPVIVITSRTTQKHRQQAMDAGINLYVTKPYAEETLLSNIQSFLN